MLIELCLVHALRDAVKIREEVDLESRGLRIGLPCLPEEVVDQHLRVDLLLYVEWRGIDDKIAPVLVILSAPDELGIEVNIAGIPGRPGTCMLLIDYRLMLGGGDVLPLRLTVGQCLDFFGRWWITGHDGLIGFGGYLAVRVSTCLLSLILPVLSRGRKT